MAETGSQDEIGASISGEIPGDLTQTAAQADTTWQEDAHTAPAQPAGLDLAESPADSTARRKAVGKRLATGAAAVIILAAIGLISFGIGNSGKSALRQNLADTQAKLSVTQGKLSSAQSRLTSTLTQLGNTQAQLQQAQQTAQQATATAQAQAKADYAAKLAQLRRQQQDLSSQQQAVKAEAGQLDASAISGSGVYVVGQDIKSGTWHTSGDGGQTDNECYFATLSGPDNIRDINYNNNFDGAETVNVSGSYALEIGGPCTWYHVG